MVLKPRHAASERRAGSVSAVVRGRRVILRGPAGHLRKTRPFLADT